MVTTTSITAVSVSMRSAQEVCSAPESMKRKQLDARLMPLDADLIEGEPGEKRGDQHEARGDDFARARGHKPAKEAGKDGADQREKDDRLIHRLLR